MFAGAVPQADLIAWLHEQNSFAFFRQRATTVAVKTVCHLIGAAFGISKNQPGAAQDFADNNPGYRDINAFLFRFHVGVNRKSFARRGGLEPPYD